MTEPSDIDPVAWLTADRQRARAQQDPCANLCTLASVDANGHPQARTVVLRDLTERLAIFGNSTSPKWRQLASSASLAVVVWLPTLEVQYRLQCRTRPVPKALVHESWQLRPDVPKRLDWFYTRVQAQSSVIESRQALTEGLEALNLRAPLTAPRTAAGLFLEPEQIERLELGMADGLHARQGFRRQPNGWRSFTLVP